MIYQLWVVAEQDNHQDVVQVELVNCLTVVISVSHVHVTCHDQVLSTITLYVVQLWEEDKSITVVAQELHTRGVLELESINTHTLSHLA